MVIKNFKGTLITQEFYKLAELLNQIIGEGEFLDTPDFHMPEKVILETAFYLQNAFIEGEFMRDDEGRLYYSGMTEDFGGLFEAEYLSRTEIKN